MKRWMKVFVMLVALLGLTAAGFPHERVTYGEPVKFAKGKELRFDDLRIRYLGARTTEPVAGKPGFTMQDFVVTGRRGAQKITWIGGTGEAVPVVIVMAGKNYVLELQTSVGAQPTLAADELVVWPEEQYRERKAAR